MNPDTDKIPNLTRSSSTARGIAKAAWIIHLFLAGFGLLLIFLGFVDGPRWAPVQSTYFIVAIALAVVPYTIARALEELSRD